MTSINLTNAKLSSLKRDKIAGEKTLTDKTGLKIKIRGRKNKDNSIRFFFRHVKNSKDTFQLIGEYPIINLEEAREEYFRLKGQLNRGCELRLGDNLSKKAIKNEPTIKKSWQEFWDLKKVSLKENTIIKYDKYYLKYFKPYEEQALSSVTTDFIFNEIVKPLQVNGHFEAINFIVSMYRQMLDYAVFTKKIPNNDLKNIANFLPKKKSKHYPAFSLENLKEELKKFFNAFANEDPSFQCLLHGYFYTLLRNTELRTLKWDEVKDGYFIVQTKVHADFKVPIVPQLQHIFNYLKHSRNSLNSCSPYVFCSRYGGCYSDNTLTKSLKLKGYKDKHSIHGTRACARQWMQEEPTIKETIAELCLCHVQGNLIEQAYNRGTYFKERERAMQLWANFVDECIGNNGNFYKNVS